MATTFVPGFGSTTIGKAGFKGHFAQNNGDFRVRIKINDFGLRNPESVEKAGGRVWVVGDSFTFGWGVEQNEMYSSVIAQALGTATYNVASPGTNVCGYQALIARMPAKVRPRAVVVGLTMENDISLYDCNKADRKNTDKQKAGESASRGDEAALLNPSLAGFKGLLFRQSAFYNVAITAMKRVQVINEWFVRLGLAAREHVDRKTIAANTVDAIAKSTAGELVRLRNLLAPQTPLLVLLIPARFDIRDGAPVYRQLRQSMARELSNRGLTFIDPFDEFKRAGFGPTHFPHDG
ncbi:MAG: hypothetical protein O3A85_13540, partial [Proteobacteria bacterium]|nr:hypothetical protein [Pseudomonadota bacterium]